MTRYRKLQWLTAIFLVGACAVEVALSYVSAGSRALTRELACAEIALALAGLICSISASLMLPSRLEARWPAVVIRLVFISLMALNCYRLSGGM